MLLISHYDFMDKYIDDFFKEILKKDYIGRYDGYVSAHGDKFYSEKTEYAKRDIGFGVGVMMGMILCYTKKFRTEYEKCGKNTNPQENYKNQFDRK